MKPVRYAWDESKEKTNRRKHRVSFEEAQTVFDNPLAVIFDDEWHSTDERREIIIGHSRQNRLLLVCFTQRSATVRIITARFATRQEQSDYEESRRLPSP